jgi:type I restriction enzyme S subunit
LVGKTALFDLENEMIIAGYIIRVRINLNEVIPIYVVRYMNTAFMKSYFVNLCKGAVNQANINSKELKAIPIPVPPLSLQQEFASKIEAIEKQKELIKQSIAETETLFNSRMDYYFN